MPVNVHVVFYSLYGHVYRLAQEIAHGAREVDGANVTILQVPELLSDEIIGKMGATDARKALAHIPVAKATDLVDADAIIFGCPTRYGNVVAQMQSFLDSTGQLWAKGALIGKVASAFTSTATQHGGQETTLRSLHTEFFHHGLVVVGVPYSCTELTNMTEITGGSPYGATTIAGSKGERQPSANELAIARFQGRHVTEIAKKLAGK
jgi:NAD(P)H dehydrogenase (quinone)